jgi:uncharacterized protein YjeT (DUF2065 family)|tara:strand:- start:820 stop:1017 length:198 start_codon:yes stop_codon:yes gene_type:complete
VNEALLESLFIATALMLIIEGVMPFIVPAMFRRTLSKMMGMSDESLRGIGLFSMCLGLTLLYWVH